MSSTSRPRISNGAAPAGAAIMLGAVGRFIPSPMTRAGQIFRGVMTGVGAAVSGASGFPGVDSEYALLLQEQVRIQQQMQLVSLYSNIERSKHETQMVSIRNLRMN